MNQNPTPPGSNSASIWKKCSSCKKDIPFGAKIYLCSVSTCRHKRTGFRFCSVNCWDAHLGFARHRTSYAEEGRAPTKEQFEAEEREESGAAVRAPVKKIIDSAPTSTSLGGAAQSAVPQTVPKTDTLVVVSKVKQLIREQSDFNTSECCVDALTKKVVEECLRGIEHAKKAGRKTVMGRDIL